MEKTVWTECIPGHYCGAFWTFTLHWKHFEGFGWHPIGDSAAFRSNSRPQYLQFSLGTYQLCSYLSDRAFNVNIHNFLFTSASLFYGVPQGSVLFFFPWSCCFWVLKHVSFHCYADDCQLYLPLTPNSPCCIQHQLNCLDGSELYERQKDRKKFF